jgi:hypothetical protein
MDTTIGVGTTHTDLTHNTINSTTQTTYYFTRFVSPPLAAQTIAAATWTINFVTSQSNNAANFPGSGVSIPIPITCYVWRPSNGTKVGDILNGTSDSNFNEQIGPATNIGTFSGGSLAIQDGDVLCIEFIFQLTQGTSTSRTIGIYFDGDTIDLADGKNASRHASFLENPNTISLSSPSGIDMTVSNVKVPVHPKPIVVV